MKVAYSNFRLHLEPKVFEWLEQEANRFGTSVSAAISAHLEREYERVVEHD